MLNYITRLHYDHKTGGGKNCSSVLTHQHVFMVGYQKDQLITKLSLYTSPIMYHKIKCIDESH